MDRGDLPHDDLLYQPITPSFGAELSGVRLVDLAPGVLRDALHRYGVLVARDQHLTHAEQVVVARSIGEPTPAHPVVPGHPDHPEILVLDGASGGRNARWHTDVTFVVAPPAASVLVADEVPAVGGDTLWADLRAAHDSLSLPMRTMLAELDAVHRITPLAYWGEPADSALGRDDALALLRQAAEVPPVMHPVVRVHPTTRRPALFVNPGFTSHVVGMSRVESDGLLALLHAHTARPEHTLRHRWRNGDVVLWDNQATMHYAVDDYGSADRRMRRVTVRGEAPLGLRGQVSAVVADPLLAVR